MLKQTLISSLTRFRIYFSLFNADEEDHSVCLFCRSEDKISIDEYLVDNRIEGLTKVISINEVRKLYKAYKDIKKLLSEHTHFICDTNILTQLYNLLGKTFADRNNAPIPVSYNAPSKIQAAMMKAVSSSYIHLKGQTITIRLGLLSMSESDVIANTLEGLDFAIEKLKGGWNDVTCIHMKTSDSPALPIYNKSDSEMMNFVNEKAKITDQKVVKKTAGKESVDEPKGKKAKVVKADDIVEKPVTTGVKGGKGKAKTADAASSSKKVPEVEIEEELVETKVVKKVVASKTSVKKRKAEEEAEVVEESAPAPKVVKKAGKKTPVKKV
jgi:ribosome biogenesis protein UTP30